MAHTCSNVVTGKTETCIKNGFTGYDDDDW